MSYGLLDNAESPTTSAVGQNVGDFFLYPLNPWWILMLLIASGTSILALCLSVSTNVSLAAVCARLPTKEKRRLSPYSRSGFARPRITYGLKSAPKRSSNSYTILLVFLWWGANSIGKLSKNVFSCPQTSIMLSNSIAIARNTATKIHNFSQFPLFIYKKLMHLLGLVRRMR